MEKLPESGEQILYCVLHGIEQLYGAELLSRNFVLLLAKEFVQNENPFGTEKVVYHTSYEHAKGREYTISFKRLLFATDEGDRGVSSWWIGREYTETGEDIVFPQKMASLCAILFQYQTREGDIKTKGDGKMCKLFSRAIPS